MALSHVRAARRASAAAAELRRINTYMERRKRIRTGLRAQGELGAIYPHTGVGTDKSSAPTAQIGSVRTQLADATNIGNRQEELTEQMQEDLKSARRGGAIFQGVVIAATIIATILTAGAGTGPVASAGGGGSTAATGATGAVGATGGAATGASITTTGVGVGGSAGQGLAIAQGISASTISSSTSVGFWGSIGAAASKLTSIAQPIATNVGIAKSALGVFDTNVDQMVATASISAPQPSQSVRASEFASARKQTGRYAGIPRVNDGAFNG